MSTSVAMVLLLVQCESLDLVEGEGGVNKACNLAETQARDSNAITPKDGVMRTRKVSMPELRKSLRSRFRQPADIAYVRPDSLNHKYSALKHSLTYRFYNMSYKSPLEGYENAEPLPTTINPDGKSLYNPPGPLSSAYDVFPQPIDSSNNGFDFHSMQPVRSS